MKNRSRVALVSVCSVLAFIAGRWSNDASKERASLSSDSVATAKPAAVKSGLAGKPVAGDRRITPDANSFSEDQARLLSPEERIALMRKGALIFDGTKQAEMICGVISALSKEELVEATRILGDAQGRGNFHAQAVWDAVWKQWGKLDATGCLAGFTSDPNGKSRTDARHVMQGWMDADPAAALAWAREPKEAYHEAAAAAYALTRSAGGDLKKLEAAMLTLPEGNATARDCLQDYFDIASLSPATEKASTVYEQMPASLKAAAWPVAIQRMSYSDPQEAVNWLTAHVNDPGRDYTATSALVSELSKEDPAGTVAWAAQLPVDADANSFHPAIQAYYMWSSKDAGEAKAWLQSQPAATPWVAQLQSRFSAADGN